MSRRQLALLGPREVSAASREVLAGLGVAVHHHWAGGVYCKETVIPRGVALEQHAHDHSHLSVLLSGRVRLERGQTARYLDAPAIVSVRAGEPHKVTALEPSTWLCIWRDDAAELQGDPTIEERSR